jgi:hypothetical protein
MDLEFDDKDVDVPLPATLLTGGESIKCYTLREAAMEWHRLPKAAQAQATIRVHGGRLYTAEQIGQMHAGPKPSGA